MNMKKIIASVAASAIAVSALAVSAFAADAVTFADATGKATLGDSSKGDNTRITYNLTSELLGGVKIEDVYGVQLVCDGSFDEAVGAGGSFIFSTKSKNWNAVEWGNDGAGKAITYDAAKKTLTRTESEPFFTATDIEGADGKVEGEYAQVVVDAYWGSGELKITKVAFLGKDGKELTAAAPATTTAAAPASSEAPAASADDKGSPDTGVEGVAVVAALAVLAGGAIVVAKKRK